MRPTPIFDTNVFSDVQRRRIPEKDWQFLLAHRPSDGWPLSNVTALELLAGLHEASAEGFLRARAQIKLAHYLSNGVILEDPRLLICEEILQIPFPENGPASRMILYYINSIRRAQSAPPSRTTLLFSELMAGPKKQWRETLERTADENYPDWRELFKKQGSDCHTRCVRNSN